MKKIAEDVKAFFNVRNTQDDAYFTELPHKFRNKLIEKLVAHVVGGKVAEARLLSEFFAYATERLLLIRIVWGRFHCHCDVIYDAPRLLTCSPS